MFDLVELAALKMKYTEQVNAARQELKEHRAKALVLLEEKDKEIKELTTKLMTNPSESLIDPRPSEDSTSSVEEKTFTQVHEADSGVSLMVNVPESPAAVNQHINAEEVVKMKDHVRKLQNLLRESEIRLSEEQHKVDEMRSQLQNSERSKRRSQLNIE